MTAAKFTDRIAPNDFRKMPEEYRDLVVRLLSIQADCEIGGPNVYGRRWFLNAPTADDMFRVTTILAEEIDHFRLMQGLLSEVGVDRTDLLRKSNAERYVDAFRATQVPTWADVAAFCCLIDRVGRFQLDEMVGSSYQPIERVLPQIVLQELGHVGYGVARLAQLAADPATRGEAQAAVDHWYPRALDSFGKSGSVRAERYVEWGLKHRLNEQARNDYIAEATPIIERMGLAVPDESYDRHFF
ncbi:MAG: family ATPase [Chloroflexi bacterium]|nr:family ATPase [Chloroflexota bacterium]